MSECVVSLCMCVYVYVCACVYMCVCVCVHVLVCACMHFCVYISVLSHRPKSNGIIIRCDIKKTTYLSMKRV